MEPAVALLGATASSSGGAATLLIPRAHIRKGAKGNEVVFYEVRSSRALAGSDGSPGAPRVADVAFKRFSDFALLDGKLRKNYAELGLSLPTLPPKKMFGNLEPKFVEQRRAHLEQYLIQLVHHAGPDDGVGGTLLQASADLRAFVPGGFLKEPSEELLRFEVIEVNTFGSNRPMQLTVQPRADGCLLFRDASGSGGLDSLANKVSILVADLLSVLEHEGSHVRATITYLAPAEDTHHKHAPSSAAPRSGSGATAASRSFAPSSTVLSSTPAPSSFITGSLHGGSISSTRPPSNADWIDHETESAPAPSPQSSPNGSSSAALHAARSKKKTRTLEFCAFEDRHRFVRMVKHLQTLKEAAGMGAPSSISASPSHSFSPSSSPSLTPATSPNSLALYQAPTQAWASVFTTSWNQAKEPEPEDLSHWIPKHGGSFDVIAVGVQECPTSLSDLSDAVAKHLGSAYYMIGRKALWEIKLIVFARQELALGSVIHRVETDSVATGILGLMGNKGGVAVSFRVHNLSLCFVNTHLAPHMERYGDRNRMFDEIDGALRVGAPELDVSLKFDHIFWIGDLNYRLEIPHHHILDLLATRQFDLLFPKDQLRRAQWSQEGFAGYSEGALAFPPTYKYVMPKKKGKRDLSRHNSVITAPITTSSSSSSTVTNQPTSATTATPAPAPALAPLPSVTEEAEDESGQSLRPGRGMLMDDSQIDFGSNFSPVGLDRMQSRSAAPSVSLMVNPAIAAFAAMNLGLAESSRDLDYGSSEDEEEASESELGSGGHGASDDDDHSSDRDEICSELIAASTASVSATNSTNSTASTQSSTSSEAPPAAQQSALDSADAALFEALDPDFAGFTRTRFRANRGGSQPPTHGGVDGSLSSTSSADSHGSGGSARPLPPRPVASTATTSATPAGELTEKGARSTSVSHEASSVFVAALASEESGPLSAQHVSEEKRLVKERKSIKIGDGRRRSATVPGAPKRKVFSRAYGKKRIPSWCDRILFRSHKSDQLKLKAYYRCDLVATSDHIPVCATFDLRVPLCPPLPAYSFPASVLFAGLTLDLTVHPLKLERENLDFLDKIYVTFYGSVLAETSRGKRTGYATIKNADGSVRSPSSSAINQVPTSSDDGPDLRPLVVFAAWNECDLPVLQCVLGDAEYLTLETLFFVIKSGDELAGGADLVLGQGQISLASLVDFFPPQERTGFFPPPPAHISASAHGLPPTSIVPKTLHAVSPSPFSLSLAEGQDGSIGVGIVVRAPPQPLMYRAPVGSQQVANSWSFCGLVERHSAALGTLNGTLTVSIEKPEPDEHKKSEEQLIQEVLAQE